MSQLVPRRLGIALVSTESALGRLIITKLLHCCGALISPFQWPLTFIAHFQFQTGLKLAVVRIYCARLTFVHSSGDSKTIVPRSEHSNTATSTAPSVLLHPVLLCFTMGRGHKHWVKTLCSWLMIASILTVQEILNSLVLALSVDTKAIPRRLGTSCDIS